MKYILRQGFYLLLIPVLILFSAKVEASHSVGADLSYACLGNNRYQITLNFYRDCAGISAPTSPSVSIRSASCGYNLNLTLTLQSSTEVTPICPSMASQSRCQGGTFPGIEQYIYTGIITLPAQCPDWTISYTLCCRNSAITNLSTPGSQDLYIQATLNNTGNLCNNSPVFTTLPVPYICANQPFFYNHGTVDFDGDSLVFYLANPLTGNAINIPYVLGYSPTNPFSTIGPFNFDPVSGQMGFTPNGVQQPVVSVVVEEYRNGQLIGSTMRDIQLVIINCNNTPPTASGINGSTSYSISVCAGYPVCFDILTNDPDAGQSVTLSWNSGIPGATFQVSGSPHPVATFCWTPTINDIGVNNFSVIVEDDACPVTSTNIYNFQIIVKPPLQLTIVDSIPESCQGAANGTLIVSVSGGNPPYQFQWNTNPPQYDSIADNLTAGVYAVTVTDADSCQGTIQAVLNPAPPPLFTIALTSDSVSCNGGSDGSASVAVQGSSGVYSYLWSTNATTPVIQGLSAGLYSVTVSDSAGCQRVDSIRVYEPAPVAASGSVTDVSCYGGNDGSIALQVSGGTGPYSFAWSNNQQTAVVSQLQAGMYQVTISDANGCSLTKSFTVSQPAPITISTTANAALCYGSSDGSAHVNVSGGTPPYSYQWNTQPVQTTATAGGLSAGSYTVTVTDSAGCVATRSVVVTQPTEVNISIALTPPSCAGGNDGQIAASATGGTSPYNYQWSNAQQGAVITQLTTGSYSVTVTDDHGCMADTAVWLDEPAPLALTITGTDVSCYGGSDGTATVTVAGGTPTYSYLWSTNATTPVIQGLSAGVYSVTVSDSVGCQRVDSIRVYEPAPVAASGSVTDVSCYGGNDGSIALQVSGGTGPYSFTWSNNQQTAVVSQLQAGVYQVTISDANGCSLTQSYTVSQPAPITTSTTANAALCYGSSDGSAHVNVSGGTPPYSYQWNTQPVQTTAAAGGLSAGSYTVTVTDSAGCMATGSVVVTQPTEVNISVALTPPSCAGGNDGQIAASATGGTSPYNYQWSNAQQGAVITQLTTGSYSVTVTDDHGCMADTAVWLDEPAPLALTITGTDVSCYGGSDGTATVTVAGGTPTYSYLWSTQPPQLQPTASGLSVGNYRVTVTDDHGCTDSASILIDEPPPLVIDMDFQSPVCFNGQDGWAVATVSGGVQPYFFDWMGWQPDNVNNNSSLISDIPAGTYTVMVSDANQCIITGSVTLINPPPLQVNIEPPSPVMLDFGDTVRLIALSPAGVVGYLWEPDYNLSCNDCQNPLASPVTDFSYQVTVIDTNGCTGMDTVDVIVSSTKILYIPNAFTPNADGRNDRFNVYAKGVERFNLKIFNRWGELMFESYDQYEGWDGYYKGELQPPGVYVYVTRVIFRDKKEIIRKGSVTLIR